MADDLLSQQPLALMTAPQPSLDRGVTGANAEALLWLERFCQPEPPMVVAKSRQAGSGLAGGLAATSLYLWGPPGSGKSFWTQAWAQASAA